MTRIKVEATMPDGKTQFFAGMDVQENRAITQEFLANELGVVVDKTVRRFGGHKKIAKMGPSAVRFDVSLSDGRRCGVDLLVVEGADWSLAMTVLANELVLVQGRPK